MSAIRRFLPLLFAAPLLACAHGAASKEAPADVAASAPPAQAAPVVAAAPVAGEMPRDIHWFRNSAEQRGVYLQTYALAAERLAEIAKGKQPGTWVVSLDADETVIDNSQFQRELAEAGAKYSFDAWTAWCRRAEAKALPGAAEFLGRVHELGGKIAIVTNRDVSVQAETEKAFENEGLPYDFMLCKNGREDGDKERRWDALAQGTAKEGQGPLEVVMWIGDNIQDFPDLDQTIDAKGDDAFAAFGEKYFVLPNPMYGSWERNEKK